MWSYYRMTASFYLLSVKHGICSKKEWKEGHKRHLQLDEQVCFPSQHQPLDLSSPAPGSWLGWT